MKNILSESKNVSIIGLGSMGSVLARLLLRKGYPVTVWNRTASKANQLIEEGAVLAESVEEAVYASPVIVICVYDYKASASILREVEGASFLAGKTLLQLTTGSPKDANEGELWAKKFDALYLDGAIQAAPSQMGQPDTPIFVSGSEHAFSTCEAILKVFAGGVTYLGASVEAAAAMDLASLSYMYGAMVGFFHGARIAETSGINLNTYGSMVAGISPTFGEFLKHESAVIDSGDFTISESPLRINVEATERILKQTKEMDLNSEFSAYIAGLFRNASEAGFENEEVAAIIKVLRKETVYR